MSQKKATKLGPEDHRIPAGNAWDNAWKIAAALGVLGSALALFGWSTDADRFAFSWLYALMVFLTFSLGSIFFVMITYFSNGFWGIALRRIPEVFAVGVIPLAVLFVPIALSTGELYEWAGDHGGHDDHGGHGDGHASGESLVGASVAQAQDEQHGDGHDHDGAHDAGASHHSPHQEALHHELMEHKSGWLSGGRWLVSAVLYFLVWIGLALLYFGTSRQQDKTRDVGLTARLQSAAPLGFVFFGLALTFAAFDWVMSLEPTWYSTIYGVYIFAGCGISVYAIMILMSLGLQSQGLLTDVVNTDHYHDLGKMMFGFVVFHAYTGASQLLLIWYANIPEETVYYYWRWHAEGWGAVSVFLILGHFVFPFLFLISRNVKRRLPLLGFGAGWMLFVHAVDLYWFVMPNATRGVLSPHWLDLASLLGVGGVYLAVVFFVLRLQPLIPVGDPRLARSLNHTH